MGKHRTNSAIFSKDMIPKKSHQEKNLFTLKPKMQKTVILRKRNIKMVLLDSIDEINESYPEK